MVSENDKGLGATWDFFVSYAQVDQAWALWIADTLRGFGFSVFLAADSLKPGRSFVQAISGALARSRAFIAVISDRALESSWVRAELAAGVLRHLPILAVKVDSSVPVPRKVNDVSLNKLQLVDISDLSLADARRQLRIAIKVGSESRRDSPRTRPPEVPHYFVNRKYELEALRELFHGYPPRYAVLTGMTGIGKTVLAAQFVELYGSLFEHIEWVDARVGEEELADLARAVSQDTARTLIIIDNVKSYHDIGNALAAAPKTDVLIASRNPRWGPPFLVVDLHALEKTDAVDLLRRLVPVSLSAAVEVNDKMGGHPLALRLAARALEAEGVQLFHSQLNSFNDLVRGAASANSGFFSIDTDDPRLIKQFETGFLAAVDSRESEVELLPPERGSWSRRWRRRYSPERLEQFGDKTERAVEVTALVKPEAEANQSNAEAIARLLEASASIPNMVVASGSVLFIKVTDASGTRVFSKTLSASEMRHFEQHEQLFAHPLQALEYLGVLRAGEAALRDPAPPPSPVPFEPSRPPPPRPVTFEPSQPPPPRPSAPKGPPKPDRPRPSM